MSKLFSLVKYSLINSFGINKFIKKKSKESKLPVILVGLSALVIFAIVFLYLLIYGKLFNDSGNSGGILLFCIIMGAFFIALTSLSTVNGYLFNPKDFELLMSLPLKTSVVFSSKVVDLLIINYVSMLYFFVPGMIIYSFYNDTNALYWILSIITFFLVPLLPITIFGVIGYLFNMIKLDIRVKKMIRSILMVGFTIAILVFSFSLSSSTDEDAFYGIIGKLKNVYYVGVWAYNGIRGNLLEYLLFVIASVVPFGLLVMFASKNYLKSNSKDQTIYKSKNKEIKVKSNSKVTTLLKKEIKNYFLLPIYVGNTIIGPILSTIGVVFLIIRAKADLVIISSEMEAVTMGDILPLLMIALISLTTTMSPPTSASVSLEGKSMWILKSSPIDYNDVKRSKLYTSYIIAIPFIIINVIILLILKDFKWYEYLLIGIIPILLVFAISKFGLLFNLLRPRFDFDNPAKPIKQGLPVLLTMLVSFGFMVLVVVPGLIIYAISLNNLISYVMMFALSILLYLLSTILLNSKGRKCYYNIVC